jgi:hypothetical protein
MKLILPSRMVLCVHRQTTLRLTGRSRELLRRTSRFTGCMRAFVAASCVLLTLVGIAPAGASASGGNPLIYLGGPVVHGTTTYAIYWGPASSWDPGYKRLINRFLRDVAVDSATGRNSSANMFALTQQYTDGHGPAQYSERFGGALADTTPYPTDPALRCAAAARNGVCLQSLGIEAHLGSFITAHHLPTGLHSVYFVFTPRGVSSSKTDGVGCAFHGAEVFTSKTTPFSFNPYISGSACAPSPFFHPNHSTADPTLGGIGHELVEVVTDPIPLNNDAWRTEFGFEIADQCNSEPALSFPRTPGFTQRINGHLYFLLGAWSNLDGQCMFEMVHFSVPRLGGRTLPESRVLLRLAHLRVGSVIERSARSGSRGRVLSQHPAPGSWLRAGARVDLTISR